jgi:hypothetical protein
MLEEEALVVWREMGGVPEGGSGNRWKECNHQIVPELTWGPVLLLWGRDNVGEGWISDFPSERRAREWRIIGNNHNEDGSKEQRRNKDENEHEKGRILGGAFQVYRSTEENGRDEREGKRMREFKLSQGSIAMANLEAGGNKIFRGEGF